MARPSNHTRLSDGVGLSRAMLSIEEMKTNDLSSVESRGDGQLVEHSEEATSSSHPRKGILINNP